MLIRLMGHYLNNPKHIDKLIVINGLPDEWIFRKCKYGGVELVSPWEPDIIVNIPKEIRHLCTPVEITKVYPPIEKGRDEVVERMTILGIRFNYGIQPGIELWEKIERYLEWTVPRDMAMPQPVMAAPDHLSPFAPTIGRRNARGSLEYTPTEIPVIELPKRDVELSSKIFTTPYQETTSTAPAYVPFEKKEEPKEEVTETPVVREPEQKDSFTCDECKKEFPTKKGVVLHKIVIHKKKKALVGV